MSLFNFETLCADFCETVRAAVPALRAEREGVAAFHVEWRDVIVDVMFDPSRSCDHAFLVFQLGSFDHAPHEPHQVLLALMQANFTSMGIGTPTFGCLPDTGIAVLQCVYPIDAPAPAPAPAPATPSLFALIEQGVDLALEWRRSYFLGSDAERGANPAAQSAAYPAACPAAHPASHFA